MKRYCPSCGTPITQQAVYCGHCGLALHREQSPANSTRVVNRDERTQLTVSQSGLTQAPENRGTTASRWRRALLNPSTLALLVSNAVVIAFAYDLQWSLITLLWIYWAQSVIIGVFTVFKILDLTRFSTDGFYINDQPVAPTEKTKRFTAHFFALHYGIFHLMYFGFLAGYTFFGFWTTPPLGTAAATAFFILTSVALFFANHLYSYLHNREQERKLKRNIGSMMFLPYARIIPMQLSLVLGVILIDQVALILFLALKTFADVIMHVAEHAQEIKST
jgi:protein-S-isoprenylcysteine O-methyltransferase Ste14